MRRFSSDPKFSESSPRDRGEFYPAASAELLDIGDISPTTVQVCVLLGAYSAASGDTGAENMYYTLAGRMAMSLDLPNRPVDSLLKRELNIRTFWSICMVDVWSSTAVKLPRIMPIDNNTVPMPIDDILFLSMGAAQSHTDMSGSFEAPLMCEVIKLNRTLSKIIDFNRKCVEELLEGPSLEAGVRSLSRELEAWMEALPLCLHETPENFKLFSDRELGRAFVAVYLGACHYGQLLNYQFLGATTATTSSVHADECKAYARKLCDLVYRSFDTSGSEVLYSVVSHILVIASTVQIHTLLFSGDETEVKRSKRRLERNFEILLRLRSYWPSVDGAMSRLRAFHQTCLRSTNIETSFVLDRWLLRFLVQFASHMELEPREHDPEYETLLALSRCSPVRTVASCESTSR